VNEHGRLHGLNRLLSLGQGGDCIYVQIHPQSVAELFGDEFGIDTPLAGQTGMRTSHDLKGRPTEFDRFEFRRDNSSPRVIPTERCGGVRRREDPSIRNRRGFVLPPLLDEMPRAEGQGHFALGAFGFGAIQIPSIKAVDDLHMIFSDMPPLQREDLPRTHARKQRQPDDQLFTEIEHRENNLNLLGCRRDGLGVVRGVNNISAGLCVMIRS